MSAITPTRPTPILTFPRLALLASERYLVGAHLLVSLIALSLGIFMGPFQTFRRSPFFMDAFPNWQIPIFTYYYQALTVHGVMNALVFTTFFIIGFTYFVVQRSLQRPLWNRQLAWIAFGLMFVGILLALYAIGSGQANVLYTFYPNMVAHPTFYLGLVLVVVGSWIAAAEVFMTYFAWKRENPGRAVPLAVYAMMANYAMWCMATVGVAIEVLFMLLPLSLGWLQTTDPQLGRVLFWFFGHPLVYFWLIPAYVSWYTMLPKQTNSKLFSDQLGRVAFLLLLIFSMPVGAHHLFSDPGVSSSSKAIHTILTLVVAVPSFLTAFNIGAVLERAGRNRGARGVAWLWTQDWGNPVVAAQLVGMLLFIAGGFSGIIHASLTLNIALHNTSWVPGHFHMTLGGAVTMTYISIVYWLLPLIRGKALFSKPIALGQIYTWFLGMLVFGHGMGEAGINGAPRRADLGAAPYVNEQAAFWLNQAAIGGALLLISSVLLFINILGTLFFSRNPVSEDGPISTEAPKDSPEWLERWGIWLGLTMLLILLAWGPVFGEALNLREGFNALPYRPEIAKPIE